MARIREFFRTSMSAVAHPTEVECGWQILAGPPTLLQLSTYGSDRRASGKKVSQTIQLDESAARELLLILKQAFPGFGTEGRRDRQLQAPPHDVGDLRRPA